MCLGTITLLVVCVRGIGYGVCYDPLHDPDMYHRSPAQAFERDLQVIRNHFSSVRTYSTVFGGIPITPHIKRAGLQAALGIHTLTTDEEITKQINVAVQAANDRSRYVKHILIGSETLVNGQDSPQKLIDLIQRVRAQVPPYVMVSTVQRPTEWLSDDPEIWRLAAACSVIAADVYPFFTVNGAAYKVETLKHQWRQLRDKYGKKVVISGTGWPSDGGWNAFGNRGCIEEARDYYYAIHGFWQSETPRDEFSVDGSDFYYFQYFDQPYKSSHSPFEANFGVVHYDGKWKPGLNIQSLT